MATTRRINFWLEHPKRVKNEITDKPTKRYIVRSFSPSYYQMVKLTEQILVWEDILFIISCELDSRKGFMLKTDRNDSVGCCANTIVFIQIVCESSKYATLDEMLLMDARW